ncbi:DUF2254 domain-containing protein [Arthrobacter roseus]|uniref:DUF2254 domain-containing protein n=1 Tax=Arthrobacter roseus TaxID=136274 RepID=UPI0019646E83|nr:DUF2254 domain-containing protein [Arthrobacter roseus]MBM7849686.1 putative membrane protein [Arthrobacter roseus]
MTGTATQTRLRTLRESFWFVPTLLCIAALLIAQLMVAIDQVAELQNWGALNALIFHVGPAGGRDILTAIAGSVLTVAATSFSITISVLATASATYGPRLVRNFMKDRANQYVLGVFCATFLYCLMVLRTIRAREESTPGFVPDIAVNGAVLLAVLNVAVLVFFIHHIADSIQVSTLAGKVRRELQESVEAAFPERDTGADNSPTIAANPPNTSAGLVHAEKNSAYIQAIDTERIMKAATDAGAVVRLPRPPGAHVIKDDVVAEVWPASCADDLADTIRNSISAGQERTPYSDPRFAVQQVVEMGVRALSPSTNDPYTARNALDEVASGLALACSRPEPQDVFNDDDSVPRLFISAPTTLQLLDETFDPVRTYALEHPIVILKACELAQRLFEVATAPEILRGIHNHVRLLVQAFEGTRPMDRDVLAVRRAAEPVLSATLNT